VAGRRPKPTALKVLEGNPGHRPLNDAEPLVPKGCPERPKGLSFVARREWNRITADLAEAGLLARTDGKALMGYCDAYSDWQEANRMCQKHGISIQVMGAFGMVWRSAPWFNQKHLALKTMKTYLIEFGLTPASRSRLRVDKPKADPEGDALLDRDVAKQQKDAAQEDADMLNAIPDTLLQ
jgi:P27 family predicted phage terminase small subunit